MEEVVTDRFIKSDQITVLGSAFTLYYMKTHRTDYELLRSLQADIRSAITTHTHKTAIDT